jgi:thymidine phosphorylase
MDVRGIGLSLVSLKAGRTKADDVIDHAVGLTRVVQIGQAIEVGQPLAYAHVRSAEQLQLLQGQLAQLIKIDAQVTPVPILVKEIIQAPATKQAAN